MPDEIVLKIISYSLAVVSSLFVFIGGLLVYIYRSHVRENEKLFDENRDDHKEINKRIGEIILK